MIPNSKPWRITYEDGSVRYTVTPTRRLAGMIAVEAYKPVRTIGRVKRVPYGAGDCYGKLSREVQS